MINIIVAMDRFGLIGNNDKLPWNIPSDLEYFKQVTTGHIIVMGRKTWDSLPKKPLPNRDNLILSRNFLDITNCYRTWISSIEEILKIPNKFFSMEVFIIGGADIYKQFYHHCEKIYITYVKGNYEGNIYFPIKIEKIQRDFEMESKEITDKCNYIIMRRKK